MKFKGDIIITDPCYIMNYKNDDKTPCPSWLDFLSKAYKKEDGTYYRPRPEDYPDCRLKMIDDCNGDRSQELLLKCAKIGGNPEMISDILNSEIKAYDDAWRKYQAVPRNDWRRCNGGYNMEILGIKNYICRDTLYGDWSCTTINSDTGEVLGKFCADAGMVAVFLLDEVLKYNPDFDYHISKPWTTTWIKDFDGEVYFSVVHTEGVYEDDSKWHTKGEKLEDDSVQVVGKGNINFVGMQTGL